MEIKFKRKYIYGFKQKNSYEIYDGNDKVGEIVFKKKNKIFILANLSICESYRDKHYGYKIVEYILYHYKIKCIVGQTLYKSRGFWNKCIKKFNGQRKNITTLDNCSSTFIIPKYVISNDELVTLLDIEYEID